MEFYGPANVINTVELPIRSSAQPIYPPGVVSDSVWWGTPAGQRGQGIQSFYDGRRSLNDRRVRRERSHCPECCPAHRDMGGVSVGRRLSAIGRLPQSPHGESSDHQSPP